MKTYAKKKSEIQRNWLHVDAKDQVVGRVASQVAMFLMGKHKTDYSPHLDTGDFVVVTNIEKLRFTGKKLENKLYHRHTGFINGIRTTTAGDLLAKNPEKLFRIAVKGMLPKSNLSLRRMMKLKIYKGEQHPHSAQKLTAVKISASGKVVR